MRHSLISVILVALLVLVPVGLVGFTQNSQAQAISIPDTITVTVPGDPITIKLPVDPITIRLPGATHTVTVPAPAVTVTQPGGTETVFNNGPTATVTKTQAPEAPTDGPSDEVTVTEEPTQTDTGQVGTDGATIDPEEEDDGFIKQELNLSGPEAVGLGALALLLIAGLILLSMYGGYILGYKDSDKAEARFLKSLLRK